VKEEELELILKQELQKVYLIISMARRRQGTLQHYLTRLRLRVPVSVVIAEIKAAGEDLPDTLDPQVEQELLQRKDASP
jgi:hypothetical protein